MDGEVRKDSKGVTVSQCHDVYEPEEIDRTEAGAGIRMNGRHGCHFVSEVHGKIHVVRVVGSLDWMTEAEFSDLLRDQCWEPILIVDLAAGHIDAAGTGALVLATEQARRRRQQLVLVATDPVQLAVMISTGLNIVVPIVSTEDEAVTWCERHGVPPWDAPPAPAMARD
jgi:anti-anti-sigma factor